MMTVIMIKGCQKAEGYSSDEIVRNVKMKNIVKGEIIDIDGH